MKGYPLTLVNLTVRRCVVVGGGTVAERKVAGLLGADAVVEVISPDLTPQLAAWQAAGRIQHRAAPFAAGDLAGAWLVVAATDQRTVNAAVTAEAQALGLLINVADDPGAGNFHTSAAIRRDDLVIAVSTDGASPAMAALIRRRLETVIGPEYSELSAWLREVRTTYGPRLRAADRTVLYRALATEEALAWLRAGEHARLRRFTAQLVDTLSQASPEAGAYE